jgi:hypothetical protein
VVPIEVFEVQGRTGAEGIVHQDDELERAARRRGQVLQLDVVVETRKPARVHSHPVPLEIRQAVVVGAIHLQPEPFIDERGLEQRQRDAGPVGRHAAERRILGCCVKTAGNGHGSVEANGPRVDFGRIDGA